MKLKTWELFNFRSPLWLADVIWRAREQGERRKHLVLRNFDGLEDQQILLHEERVWDRLGSERMHAAFIFFEA